MTPHQVRTIALAGLACVVVGVCIALLSGLLVDSPAGLPMRYEDQSPSPSPILGWFLLTTGIAAASGVAGFVLGARRTPSER